MGDMTRLNTREKTQEDETLGEELKSKARISKIRHWGQSQPSEDIRCHQRSFVAFLFVK